ncbi:hypothetical protein JOF41_005998 [Saccharothrix coeruleofusca]|uniref:hypothetical protein n=1 Tax=Saccharothrix coeruleofusca TaxID=33919 RepID=UPI001AE175E5|nr:hypothetical protein [Saccharothrix coeruleofusca]MBP2339820.1 hypothetical protein [Saccharothrix coeruleofusca]
MSSSSCFTITGETPMKCTATLDNVELNLGQGQLDLLLSHAALERLHQKTGSALDWIRENESRPEAEEERVMP